MWFILWWCRFSRMQDFRLSPIPTDSDTGTETCLVFHSQLNLGNTNSVVFLMCGSSGDRMVCGWVDEWRGSWEIHEIPRVGRLLLTFTAFESGHQRSIKLPINFVLSSFRAQSQIRAWTTRNLSMDSHYSSDWTFFDSRLVSANSHTLQKDWREWGGRSNRLKSFAHPLPVVFRVHHSRA